MRGDGKSSLTSNLGIALAQAGRRVLLVDMSYRRPCLENLFGLDAREGLAEILGRSTTSDSQVNSTRLAGLFVLGPGLDSENLVGKLASRDMVTFLESATQQFDHVILDTPPWLIMADARLLAPLVEGVLVVVGSGVSTLGMVTRCLKEVKESGANVLGLILNGTRSTPGGYMKKNRELYHGYDSNDDSSRKASAQEPVIEGRVVAGGTGAEG
jgi:capsular exopolysaccharide synthesis family protein